MLVLREKTLLSDNRKLRKHQRFSLVCSTRHDNFFPPKHIFQGISVPLHPHLTPPVHILQPGSRKQHLSVHQTRTGNCKICYPNKNRAVFSARVLCGSEAAVNRGEHSRQLFSARVEYWVCVPHPTLPLHLPSIGCGFVTNGQDSGNRC